MITTFTTTVYDYNEYDYDLIVEFETANPEMFQYWKQGSDGHKLSERPSNLGAVVNDNVRKEILKHTI
jgi:hypothetical protein